MTLCPPQLFHRISVGALQRLRQKKAFDFFLVFHQNASPFANNSINRPTIFIKCSEWGCFLIISIVFPSHRKLCNFASIYSARKNIGQSTFHFWSTSFWISIQPKIVVERLVCICFHRTLGDNVIEIQPTLIKLIFSSCGILSAGQMLMNTKPKMNPLKNHILPHTQRSHVKSTESNTKRHKSKATAYQKFRVERMENYIVLKLGQIFW